MELMIIVALLAAGFALRGLDAMIEEKPQSSQGSLPPLLQTAQRGVSYDAPPDLPSGLGRREGESSHQWARRVKRELGSSLSVNMLAELLGGGGGGGDGKTSSTDSQGALDRGEHQDHRAKRENYMED